MSSQPVDGCQTLRVGLTGGIASGKSMVQGFLEELGVPVIDADAVTHQLLAQDLELQGQIRQHFGASVVGPDGVVDRSALAQVIFADPTQRKRLESWIHPKVRERIQAFFDKHQGKAPLVVASIPLIFESGLENRFDAVWLVYCTEAQQIERLMTHRGYTQEDALARIRAQMPLAEKQRRADVAINNSGPPEATWAEVRRLVDAACPTSG